MSKSATRSDKGPHWYSYQDLLDTEKTPVPAWLREQSMPQVPARQLGVDRYTSQAFFDQEVETIWRRTWQMACRVNRLRNPGDTYVYDIVGHSILIVRSDSGELKAYHNSCLHRGRKIRSQSGRSDGTLTCPFHGFSWNLDGQFRGAPCAWDFEHLKREELTLPQVNVDTWGGWVFVNLDPNCGPLLDQLGVIPEHFKRYHMENRYVSMHVEKVVHCNWKVALEAFIESYHAVHTHPQIMSYQGIDNSQYDIWGEHVSRTITPLGIINPAHIDELTIQDTLDQVMRYPPELARADRGPTFEEQLEARTLLAEQVLEQHRKVTGQDLSAVATQSELLDSILYLAFPNFAPWMSFAPAITYRHRPYGREVDKCVMDIYFLSELPEGVHRLADSATERLGINQKFTESRVMGERMAEIFEQDNVNMPEVQAGMQASRRGTLNYANYQESRIRHFHATLDRYMAQAKDSE